MAFVAAIGAAVVSAFGATATAGIAAVVGEAVVGAAVGALYSAVTGGDILKGALFGAIGGAVTGGIGEALNLTGSAAAVSEEMASAASGAGGSAMEVAADSALGIGGEAAVNTAAPAYTSGLMGTNLVAQPVQSGLISSSSFVQPNLIQSSPLVQPNLIQSSALIQPNLIQSSALIQPNLVTAKTVQPSLVESFFKSTAQSAGNNVFSLGAAFLNAGAGDDRTEEFKRQYDEDRKNELSDREAFSRSTQSAAQYAAGAAQSATLSEINKMRLELPAPVWSTGKQRQQPTTASNQINPNAGVVSMGQQTAAQQQPGLLSQPRLQGATA